MVLARIAFTLLYKLYNDLVEFNQSHWWFDPCFLRNRQDENSSYIVIKKFYKFSFYELSA